MLRLEEKWTERGHVLQQRHDDTLPLSSEEIEQRLRAIGGRTDDLLVERLRKRYRAHLVSEEEASEMMAEVRRGKSVRDLPDDVRS